MFTIVRTTVAQPGKMHELTVAGKEVVAIVKKLFSLDASLCTTLGGNVAELSWVYQAPSMEADHEVGVKLLADPEYQAVLKRIAPLVVANSTHDKIYRHI
jgi:hypothetical protein